MAPIRASELWLSRLAEFKYERSGRSAEVVGRECAQEAVREQEPCPIGVVKKSCRTRELGGIERRVQRHVVLS